ncbi:MAG: cohesin domain-containing protein [Bacteroidota bacterium]
MTNGTIIGSLCFTNNTASTTVLNFASLVVNDTNGQVANPVGNGGSINDCTTIPTCSDGIMNGDETGVDCGGSCTPCQTMTDCGAGTTDVEICIGSECADAGAEVCVPVYVGNFNSLGGLQFALEYNGANLDFTRVIPANALASGTSPGNPSDGRLNVVWNDPNLSGQSFPDDEIAFELCFTVENAVATPLTFFNEATTLRAFNELGTRLPSSGNPGAVNSNCGNEPTCSDGIMNGDETGVDCGGSCTPCNNTGGPDVNCGMGTSNISLCLGDYCDIANGAEVCVDITVGNFTDVTAFQTDIVFPAGSLTLSSSTSDPGLGDALLVNQPENDRVRIIYFQQSQTGVSFDNGDVIGSICFTNNVAGTTILNLQNLTVNTTSGSAPNPVASGGSINDCSTMPTCTDGIMNGDETGVDCGGSCAPCSATPLSLNVGNGMAAVGEQVCVNVEVEDFMDITDLGFNLNYDPAVLMLSSVTATTALPGFGSGNFNTTSSGIIGVTYASATPRSLNDNASLFEVCFTVLTGAETDLTISGATVTANGSTNLTVNTSPGTINTGGLITYDNLSVVTSDADGAMGTEVCLDYSVYNFMGVAGMQFPITYDATKLRFNSATGTGALTGLQAFSPEDGVVRIIWFDPAIQPNSLDDGTNILSVCFTVLEACETEVRIEDVPRFNIRAIDPENNPILPFDVFSGTVNEGVEGDCNPLPGNLVLDLGNAEATIGEEACIDLRVTDFTALDELSFSLVYDADEISFSGVNNFGLTSVSAANVSNPSPGVLTFDWDASGTTGQSLADDAVLLSFCFTIDRFTPTNVDFSNSPTVIQARNAAGQNIGVVPMGGTINPNVPVTDGLTFQVGSAMAGIGETVCLPVIGYEVNDLVAFQYTLTYPSNVLEYTGTGGEFALSGNVSVVNSDPGILRVVWTDANAEGNTVPDGTAIFTVCFRVLNGDVGVVSFSGQPTEIEFEDVNSIVSAQLLNGQVNGSMAPSIVEINMDPPACFGGNDGSITLSVSGGPNLTYNWSPSVSTSNEATNLAAGTYNVTVSNQSGQSTSREIVLTEGAQLEFIGDPQVTGVSCNGEADGSILISVRGGATPYSIDWCGSLPDNVLSQSDLDGGSYCVTVTDDNGCMIELPNITVGEPGALLIGGTPINITDNPGGVNVVIQGGRMPFAYSWSGPGDYSASTEDVDDITIPGTYCLTVTDNNDCEKVQCFAVIEALAYTIDVDNGCTGENNGSIDITVRGGNGSYDYEWSNEAGPFATTQDINNLSPGDYTVVITSGMEENTATITIEPEPIVAPATVVPATSGNNGSITLTPSGGNPPFSFLWDDGTVTQNRTDLSSGEYCVTIMDESACEKEFCYTVGARAIAFGASSTRPSSCSDAEDGVIRLVIDNGTAPFTVRVEPVGTQVMVDTNIIEVMVPLGTYDVTVTDAQGGEIATTLTVEGPSAITAPATITSDTEDTGCSGMISLDLGGGTGSYTVTWSNDNTGPTITQLCSGAYVATVTDANGCSFTTDTLRINRIDEVLDSIGPVACESGADGSISVTISGGVEPYSFNWTRTGSTESLATTEDLIDVAAGDYTLTIMDATGATLVKNYTVGTTSGFSVNVVVTTDYGGFGVSCPESSDARLEATISGQGDFFFEWTRDDMMVGTTQSINAQSAGTYTLIVSDDSGCEITQVTEVTAPPAITLNPTVSTISCGSTGDGAISVIASGGVGEYSYSWSTGSSATQIQGLSAGRYDLTVMDGNNCTTTESFTLAAPEDLAITFEATPADDGCNGTIMILPLGGSGNYNFSWPQLPNQGNTPLAEGLCPGEYTIEVTDDNECQTVTMVATVLDRRLPCLSTREVITPNGDGLNETLVIFCSGDEVATNNHLEVWNRWGQLVYEVEDYDCSEDGGLRCFEGLTNDGEILPPGPYYYVFEFTSAMGPRMQQRGSFTLIRD